MAGGPSSVDLVVESSEAGALGSIGAAYFPSPGIAEFVEQVRARTTHPFAINLFLPHLIPRVASEKIESAIGATQKFRDELHLPKPKLEPPYEEDFDLQFDTAVELRPAALSFVFGLLDPHYVQEAHKHKIVLIGTATTVDEARALEATGVDAITLQGIEAGGHRGIFDTNAKDPEVKTLDLLRQCVGNIRVPLVAAGGIMTRQQIGEALSLGATAVQMGTAFLACREAGTSAPYRAALLASPVRETKTTRAFSGRLARGIANRFMAEMEAQGSDAILPFPAQNKFTRDLRAASSKRNSADFLSLWSGTGAGALWTGNCRDLISTLFS